MSTVYLAEETALGRRVVIKILPQELAHALSGERFRQEIRFAARLTHPHIVPLLSAGESDGLPWYTMPYVEGESLRARLNLGPLPLGESMSLLRDVARALAYAHAHGVVHRDIKPDNILLTGGTAMVTDFGIAKALSAATGEGRTATTTLGVVLGTPAYMAPEQGASDPATDHRADIYAFGCLAYEVLTGAPPFAGRSPAELIAAHAIQTPEPLSQRRLDLPQALAELVMRCLAKRPVDRPQTATQVLEELDGVRSPTRGSFRRTGTILAATVIVVAGLALLFWLRPRTGSAAGGQGAETMALHSVAVLPFVNIGGNPEDEYFSDGMTDELAHALAGLPDIRVAGRTSSYAYKGKAAPVQEIGRALGVSGVIAGTVRRAGDRLRVTVQVSSAADGFQRWSHEYERQRADVFALQDELTRAIVAELEPALRGTAARVAGERRGTDEAEAYQHYLRGRYYWQRRGAPGLLRAIDEFRAALARDSTFARAWAGLSLVYVVLPAYAPVDADSINRLAFATARRALALDSALADAHLGLAIAIANDGRLAEADAELGRLRVLAPNDPTVFLWHSAVLQSQGRVDDALQASRRAAELDPLSAVVITDQAAILLAAGRYSEAFEAARRGLALDSTFTWAHNLLAQLHGVTGHPDSALARMGLDPPADGGSTWRGPGWRGMAAWAYALAGRQSDAERMRGEIARNPGDQGDYDAAMAAMALGDKEGAVEALGRSLDRHELFGVESNPGCTPVFDPLRRLPSFRALMSQHGVRVCRS